MILLKHIDHKRNYITCIAFKFSNYKSGKNATLQVCEKERTHADGVASPNEINSHEKFNIKVLNNTFYLLCSDMFRP
jgi:hypothetical protein